MTRRWELVCHQERRGSGAAPQRLQPCLGPAPPSEVGSPGAPILPPGPLPSPGAPPLPSAAPGISPHSSVTLSQGRPGGTAGGEEGVPSPCTLSPYAVSGAGEPQLLTSQAQRRVGVVSEADPEHGSH